LSISAQLSEIAERLAISPEAVSRISHALVLARHSADDDFQTNEPHVNPEDRRLAIDEIWKVMGGVKRV
jgi:hypothetical protein